MDVIINVTIAGSAHEELYRAVHNVDGVVIANNRDDGMRLQGSDETFQVLKDQLRAQRQEEQEYDQYEYARANRQARQAVSSALREREEKREETTA